MPPLPSFSQPAFQGLFGVARRDITPPLGIYSRNWGAAKSDVATAIHRPMTLTVVTLQPCNGGDPVALLSLDLGWYRSRVEERMLNQAVLDSGIAQGRYIIALSHTHAGPVFCPGDAAKPGGDRIQGYLDAVAATIREAIAEALADPQPGLLETATGTCPLATNRDLPDPEGDRLLVGWNPGIEADQTLLLGRITNKSGECLATLVNYACHPTILAWENETISPDFVGAMREVVENETAAPCLFLQGASGELAARHQYVGDPAIADRAGRCLGHAVLSLLHSMLAPGEELAYEGAVESGAPLALWRALRRASLPDNLAVKTVSMELAIKHDLPSEAELLEQIDRCTDRVTGERLQRKLLTRRSIGNDHSYRSPHELWKVGEMLFVSVANEAYSALQTILRASVGNTPLFVITLGNGCRGYLSPSDSYIHNSYASTQSPFAEGCFEQTVQTLKTEIQKLA